VVDDPVPADLAGAMAQAGVPSIVYFNEIDSTNDAALSLAADGAPEFTAVGLLCRVMWKNF